MKDRVAGEHKRCKDLLCTTALAVPTGWAAGHRRHMPWNESCSWSPYQVTWHAKRGGEQAIYTKTSRKFSLHAHVAWTRRGASEGGIKIWVVDGY